MHNVTKGPWVYLNLSVLNVVQDPGQVDQEIIIFWPMVVLQNIFGDLILDRTVFTQESLVDKVKKAVFSKIDFSGRKGP